MTSARETIHQALVANTTGFKIVPYLRDLDGFKLPVLMLYTETVTPSPISFDFLTNTVALWIIDPRQNPVDAEKHLESNLFKIINVLDEIHELSWSEATRGTFADKWQAYKIDITLTTKKEN